MLAYDHRAKACVGGCSVGGVVTVGGINLVFFRASRYTVLDASGETAPCSAEGATAPETLRQKDRAVKTHSEERLDFVDPPTAGASLVFAR